MPQKNSDGLPRLRPNFKLWLEHDGEYVFGPGAYGLLHAIHSTGSLTQAAKDLKMSYRYAWGILKKIEAKLDAKLIESYKGGKEGGGGATVTEYGLTLMDLYTKVRQSFKTSIADIERSTRT